MSDLNNGKVNIHGKEYLTVAYRINEFRARYPDHIISTNLVSADDDRVVVKAEIFGPNQCLISTGYAEEVRADRGINSTSALENAETSAVGRALAFFGMAGSEIASADEVASAFNQQTEKDMYKKFAKTMSLVLENIESIIATKEALFNEDYHHAADLLWEMDPDPMNCETTEFKSLMWQAPSKGGPWTTKERATIKEHVAPILAEIKKTEFEKEGL